MFTITVNGKTHIYRTLTAAKVVADAIFAKTGVLVGIERVQK